MRKISQAELFYMACELAGQLPQVVESTELLTTKGHLAGKKSTLPCPSWELFLKRGTILGLWVIGFFACLCWDLLAIQVVIAFRVSS